MKKSKELAAPCYFVIIDSSKSKASFYFMDDKNQTKQLNTFNLENKENLYFKSNQWRSLIKTTPYRTTRSANKIAQQMKVLMLSIHKAIYDHTGSTRINNEESYYIDQLLHTQEVQKYLKGKSDTKEKLEIKLKIPNLKNIFFTTPDVEDKLAYNLALKAMSFINKNRSKKIEVKGYAISISPATAGHTYPLNRDEIHGAPGKSVIYKPK